MTTSIGPYSKNRIVLCSADAGPNSQRNAPCEAGYFFPGGKWVGALRNAAERLECRFVILTTAHGMVDPDDVIEPYDLHYYGHETRIGIQWRRTVGAKIGDNRYDILVFYSGGCPREACLEILGPILRDYSISLITFGRPNMFDINKVDEVVQRLINGTSLDELRLVLRLPDRLEFFPIRL